MVQITFSPISAATLNALSLKDQNILFRNFGYLIQQEFSSFAHNHKISQFGTNKQYYVLRAGRDWRVIFEISPDKSIIIVDIVRHSQIERLRKAFNGKI